MIAVIITESPNMVDKKICFVGTNPNKVKRLVNTFMNAGLYVYLSLWNDYCVDYLEGDQLSSVANLFNNENNFVDNKLTNVEKVDWDILFDDSRCRHLVFYNGSKWHGDL